MGSATAPARYADNRFFGVAEAIVVDVEDPDRESRVRLRLPWLDSKQETEWCRTSNIFAGSGYGATWTPEVDDEVLVAFVHGDLRYPVVLGSLYNGQDKPPSARSSSSNAKVLRTKLGHQIVLDDSEGSHRLVLETSEGHRLVLDDSGHTLSLTSNGGHHVTIDDRDGSMKLSATTVEISATQSMKLTAPRIELNP